MMLLKKSGDSSYSGRKDMDEVERKRRDLITRIGPGSISEELEFAVGRIFTKAISLCLSGGANCSSSATKDEIEDDEDIDDADDALLDLEIEVVAMLRRCVN